MTIERPATSALPEINELPPGVLAAEQEPAETDTLAVSLAISGLEQARASTAQSMAVLAEAESVPLIDIIATPEAQHYIASLVRLRGARPADVDDHVQNIAITALAGGKSINPANWPGYLAVITRNHMIDDWRWRTASGKRSEDVLVDTDTSETERYWQTSATTDFSDEVCERYTMDKILAGLSLDHQRVVFLAHVVGMTQAEISETLDIPLGTAKSRLTYGMRHLKRSLTGNKYTPLSEPFTKRKPAA